MDRQNLREAHFSDYSIVCLDCGRSFAFSSGEQRFFASKGLSPPRRCSGCRAIRKLTLVPERERDA